MGSSASETQLRCRLDWSEGNRTRRYQRTSLKTNYNTNKDNANSNLFARRQAKYQDKYLFVCFVLSVVQSMFPVPAFA